MFFAGIAIEAPTTNSPTQFPTKKPTTAKPTHYPTLNPTLNPTPRATLQPNKQSRRWVLPQMIFFAQETRFFQTMSLDKNMEFLKEILKNEIREAKETPEPTSRGIQVARLDWKSLVRPGWDLLELALNEHARASRLVGLSLNQEEDGFWNISAVIERDPIQWAALSLFNNLTPLTKLERGPETIEPVTLLSKTFSVGNGFTPDWVKKAARDWQNRYSDILTHACLFEPEQGGHRATVFFLKKT